MKLFTSVLLLLFFWGSRVFTLQAQNITINNAPYHICVGSPLRLNFSSDFSYARDNKFYVEVTRNSHEEIPGKIFEASVKKGFLEVVIPRETITTGNYQNYLSLRIVTTNPVTKSDWISSQVDAFPEVHLETQKLTLDVNDQAILNFSVSGKAPILLTLKDTLSNETFPHELTHSSQFSTSLSLAADRSRAYAIHSVQNECGSGSGQGKVEIAVNSLGLKLISVSPAVACAGTIMTAHFQLSSGSLGHTNTFRVELLEYDLDFNKKGAVVTTLPAQVEGNTVRFSLPSNLVNDSVYQVYLVTSDPAMRSTMSDTYGGYFTVSSHPSAKLISASHTINYGDESKVQIQFMGIGPFIAHLQDGTPVKNDYDPRRSSIGTASVKPLQTTLYTVKDFNYGCGAAQPGISSTLITVRKGIQADSIPSKVFCEGSLVSIPIRSNFDPTGAVSVQLYSDNYGQPIQTTVDGAIKNNILSFIAPTFSARTSSRIFELKVSGKDFNSSLKGNLKVGGKPYVESLYYSNIVMLEYASVVNLGYYAYGIGPYQLTFDDGEKVNFPDVSSPIELYRRVYASASKNYRVTSMSNSCGITSVDAVVSVFVKNQIEAAIGLTSALSNKTLCNNKPIDISFDTHGKFGPNNRFKIIYSTDNQSIVLKELSTVSTAQISLASIPKGSVGYIYIESTDPVLRSNQSYININSLLAAPEIQWIPLDRTILRGQPINVKVTSDMYRHETRYMLWSDGKKQYRSEIDINGYFQFTPDVSTNFVLKGIQNQCGITAVDSISVPIVVNHAQLLFSPQVRNSLSGICRNLPVELPYGVEGIMDPNTTFDVQILSYDLNVVSDVAKNITGNPIRFNWPENLDSKKDWRYLRITSKTNKVMPVTMDLILSDKPSAILTTSDGKDYLEYRRDGSNVLQVTLYGGSPYNVIWNDGIWEQFADRPFRAIKVSRGSVYTLKSVFNSCGYGSVSGQVTVKVSPTLSIQNSTNKICKDSKIQIAYTSSGDYANDNYFRLVLINSQEKIIARLDSSSQANYQFSSVIPSSIAPGSYQIEVQSSDNQQKIRSYLYVRNTPQMTLGSNISVPAGTAATIRLRNVSPGTYSSETIQYTLSDGSKGSMPEYLQYQDLTFTPTQTTTYRVTSVSNSCGIGTATSSATITVESPSDKETQITQVQTAGKFTGLCIGDTVFVTFTTKGSVAANATYRVQLSDTTGNNFTPLTTGGALPKLWALIPTDVARSEYYRLKVTSSEAGVNSRTYVLPLSLRQPATASFIKESMLVSAENADPVLIQLGGDGPWQFQIGNEINPSRTITAITNPHSSYSYSGTPTDKPAVYKLYSVSNVCGVGKILNPSTLRVELITSVEPAEAEVIKIYPNPTRNWIRIECASAHKLRVMNLQGKVLLENDSQEFFHQLDLSPLSGGTYLLEVTTKNQKNTYRIIKE